MFQHSEYWLATIILGSILGGLVVLVGIGIYKRDAVLDKLEEFLRRRKTARSRDQPQELADVSVTLQPQDQQQQTQPQQQHQQQTQPQQFRTWEDAEPTGPKIRLQVWPDARAQPWPTAWPENWPEVRPMPQGAAEPVYANVTDEAPQVTVADEALHKPEITEGMAAVLQAFATAIANAAPTTTDPAETDVAYEAPQPNMDAEAPPPNMDDEAPRDYVFDGEKT